MLETGDWINIWVNQGSRDGTVLATIDDEALVEYEMPNGTTALQIIPRVVVSQFDIDLGPGEGRSVSYHNLPKRWLRAVITAVENGETDGWIAQPQRGRGVGTPMDVWQRRGYPVRYTWGSPHTWIGYAICGWNEKALRRAFRTLAAYVDADTIQTVFEKEMDADGYFKPLLPEED